jgi:hypothetical protein
MFRFQFLAIFMELVNLCSLYVNIFGRSFTYMVKIEIKILNNILILIKFNNHKLTSYLKMAKNWGQNMSEQ